MRRLSKILAFGMAACMAATAFVGCGSTTNSSSDAPAASGDASKGKVYYLNFKPEQDKQWQELAKAYTEETGTEVKVFTAAEGQYEQTLTAEMDKADAPTLFQVNGPVGYANWKDFCYDLAGSDFSKELKSDEFALKDGDKIPGIAYVIETYGIIYNKTLLDKYFGSDFATIKKIEDLNSFTALKTVAEEIQKNKDALGVDGAFTSAGMDGSSDWRFKTHLANMPIYYEYKDKGISQTDAIEGTYLENYKNIWDLYINNSTCDKTELASKTGADAETEFKTGKAVFYQNGTWAYGNVKDDGKAGLKDDEFGMLPIYIGAKGEEKQGLCTGSENYWCVNSKASADDIAATLKFMHWCVTSDKATTALAEDMGFVIPFKSAKAATNPLVTIADQYVSDGTVSVSWNFSSIPSEDWKNGVGAALTQYAAGTSEWDAVKAAFVDGWKIEYAKAHQG
ncbi:MULTISPECIES: ABC transporter substrate-binding protein [unclassified Ruminococcus]|uniref:ABC transporter substrate-binding protein n=1 Tax=unclassified Ruminococcus TaxID=2608920 RepID=UPI00210B17AD|nr:MULTISPECIES: ABC transporter substrate-binding protein [unclassified Ruminococcus]MCQ4021498.1 extracellular solute-binding protein [Ruminococcus sp. zg-924]MCQ4113943.1 extracellular solute-binding protein [Ruminococcus sp. zg-921]